MGGIVRHGGQVGVLAQQHIAQAVHHGKLGTAARLDRLGKVGKLRFHLLAVGAYLRGVAYGSAAAAHALGGLLPQRADVAGLGLAAVGQCAHLGQRLGGGQTEIIRRIAPAAGGDVLRRAGAAHLPGVQRRAARAVDAVAGSDLAHSKQPLDVGLPPAVDANTAVVMLGAEGDLQRLGVQIHTLITVKIDGRLVHMRQPLNRRAEAGTGPLQILPRFGQQRIVGKRAVHRIFAVIKIDFASLAGFQIHQNVDDGAAVGNLAHIKRPLVALQKQLAEHIVRVGEKVHQKLALVASVRRRGKHPRQHLHIGAGNIPARRNGGKPVLPFGQVFALCACFQRKAGGPILAEGIDAVGVHTSWAAGGPDNVFASNQRKAVGGVLRNRVQAKQAANRTAVRQNFDDLCLVQHRHALGLHGSFQTFGHLLAGVGSHAGGAAARVVVGLVADVLAVAVAGERHAQLDQLQEALGRERGLAQGNITIHAAARKQCVGHLAHAVGVAPGQGQLVVGLFVAAGVAAGSARAVFGDQHNIPLAQLPQAVGGVKARCAAADHGGIAAVHLCRVRPGFKNFVFHRKFPYRRWMWNPPSTSR